MVVRDFLYNPGYMRKALGKLIPSKDIKLRIALLLDKLNQRTATNLNLPTDYPVPVKISDRIKAEISEVQRMTGLHCEDWLQRCN